MSDTMRNTIFERLLLRLYEQRHTRSVEFHEFKDRCLY